MEDSNNKLKNHAHHIIKKTDTFVDAITKPVFASSILLLHVCYFLVFIGLLNVNTNYLDGLSIFIQVFIGLLLIYRFNPLRTAELKVYDQQIIFASAIFILTNVGFTQILKYFTVAIPLPTTIVL